MTAAHARARSTTVESLEGRRLLSAADADISFGRSPAADRFAHLPDLAFFASSEASLRMAQTGDGTMFVAGDFKKAGHWTQLGVAKLNAFGGPDMTFGIGRGYATTAMVASPFHSPGVERAIAVQTDGKVVLAAAAKVPGSKPNVYVDVIAVTRFNPDGTVDAAFGENGIGRIGVSGGLPENIQVRVLNDGQIAVQGRRETSTLQVDLFLARFTENGAPDEAIGNGAAQVTRQMPGGGVRAGVFPEILGDGKIILATGTPNGVRVTRLYANGEIDSTFGTTGSTDIVLGVGGGEMDVAIQPGGKIVVAGWIGNPTAATTKLARLNPNGTLDPTFGTNGIATGPNVDTYAVSVLGDGTIYAFGGARAYRFDPNGGLDTNYGQDGSVTFGGLGLRYDNVQMFDITPAQIPQIDPQGRILLAGIKKTPTGEQTLGVGVLRVGMDAVEYDPERKMLFIRGTDSGVDTITVEPASSGDDVIVTINGDVTTITGGVVGIHARLGLGHNAFDARNVNAGMLVSGGNTDTIVTGAGSDTIYGHSGGDNIGAGNGPNLIAGAGYALYFGGGAVTLSSGAGNDTIYGGGSNDVISAGDGNDQVFAAGGDDWIDAGRRGDDFVDAHMGDDNVWGGEGSDVIYGGRGNDTLHGNANADTVDGGAGNDKVYGEASKDSLIGGDGHDFLNGFDGNDRLFGGAGDDYLEGDRDNDVLFGDAGNDVLHDLSATDYLDGGAGDDHLIAYEPMFNLTVDTLIGGDGADKAWCETDDDQVSEVETTIHMGP